MRHFQHRFSFGWLIAATALWPVLPAQSVDAQTADGKPIGRAAESGLVGGGMADFCASYGAGFVRLQGTDTCVRIGGHVRVGTTIESGQFEWGTGAYAVAPGNDESSASHVRLDGNYGASEFR